MHGVEKPYTITSHKLPKTAALPKINNLSKDNIINILFDLEQNFLPKEKITSAKKILNKLVQEICNEFHEPYYASLSTKELIELSYSLIWQQYKKAPTTLPINGLFSRNLIDGILDCDSSSFIIIAIAYEMGWNDIQLRHFPSSPSHVVVSFKGTIFDYGNTYKEIHYAKGNLKDAELSKVAPPLSLEQIPGIFYNNAGIYYARRGNYKKAIEHFKKAVKIIPEYSVVKTQLAIINSHLNRTQSAKVSFKEIIPRSYKSKPISLRDIEYAGTDKTNLECTIAKQQTIKLQEILGLEENQITGILGLSTLNALFYSPINEFIFNSKSYSKSDIFRLISKIKKNNLANSNPKIYKIMDKDQLLFLAKGSYEALVNLSSLGHVGTQKTSIDLDKDQKTLDITNRILADYNGTPFPGHFVSDNQPTYQKQKNHETRLYLKPFSFKNNLLMKISMGIEPLGDLPEQEQRNAKESFLKGLKYIYFFQEQPSEINSYVEGLTTFFQEHFGKEFRLNPSSINKQILRAAAIYIYFVKEKIPLKILPKDFQESIKSFILLKTYPEPYLLLKDFEEIQDRTVDFINNNKEELILKTKQRIANMIKKYIPSKTIPEVLMVDYGNFCSLYNPGKDSPEHLVVWINFLEGFKAEHEVGHYVYEKVIKPNQNLMEQFKQINQTAQLNHNYVLVDDSNYENTVNLEGHPKDNANELFASSFMVMVRHREEFEKIITNPEFSVELRNFGQKLINFFDKHIFLYNSNF
jgi:tetratricopeptide (TPR) repeat protein